MLIEHWKCGVLLVFIIEIDTNCVPLRTRFDRHSTEIIFPIKKIIKAKKAEKLLDLAQKLYFIFNQTMKTNILEKIEKNLSQNLLCTSLL